MSPAEPVTSHRGLPGQDAGWVFGVGAGCRTPSASCLSAGPGEEECTPCSPEAPAPQWRCVPACREGFYPADSHGLPSKVCKRYGASSRGERGENQHQNTKLNENE